MKHVEQQANHTTDMILDSVETQTDEKERDKKRWTFLENPGHAGRKGSKVILVI